MVVEEVKLVSITDYSEHWKIDRSTTYALIEKGTLTRYSAPDGSPLLNINQRPKGVKRYGDRKRRIT